MRSSSSSQSFTGPDVTDSSATDNTSPGSPGLTDELDGFDVDPVVVCGLSVKFPQEATSADALWKMIMEKRCASTEFPADRTNPLGFFREQKRANTVSR